MNKTIISATRLFARQNWIRLVVAAGFFPTGPAALAQENSAATTPAAANPAALTKAPFELRLGPLNLHPRVIAGATYDDNIVFTSANKEADLSWSIQPAFQAVAGDDAALIAYRDQGYDILNLSPGSLIVQPPEVWPGKLFVLDYGPRFKFYNQYTGYNSIDQFGTLNLLWPMNKLILGFKQDYQLQKATIIEAGTFATAETISSALSAAYRFGEKTSVDFNFRRISTSYDQPGLIGYTEYSTEDWFNYAVTESMPVSLGVVAGYDDVAAGQNQTYEQLRLRVRYNFTQRLVLDVSGGGELRQYESGGGDTFSPVFSLSGTYHPTERTSVSLTGYRQQNASIFNGYNYTSTGATLSLSQGITDRFTADASVGYYTLDYKASTGTASDHTDDYYTARFGLQAKIIRHLNGQVFYQLVNRQSPVGGNIGENQIGVNLTLSY